MTFSATCKNRRLLCVQLGVASLLVAGIASSSFSGTIDFSGALTDDASTGISNAVTYTHKVAGSEAATIEGVVFDVLTTASAPANFTWSVSSGVKDEIDNNNGDWVPATGGVTGPGLIDLLDSFTFNNGDGANVGSSQNFVLSNLSIGQTYETRLYIRAWDDAGVGRDIDLTFTHGIESDSITIEEDRPQNAPVNLSTVHDAYYISYTFTALATSLDIDAEVAAGGDGSFHMYGLTNQEVVPEPSTLVLALCGLIGVVGFARRRRMKK